MSAIDADHLITIASLRKIVPVTDTEITDGTADELIVAQSKYIIGLTNIAWTESHFLFETVSNIVGRLVAVQILFRRGKPQDAQIMKESVEEDISRLLKSPYLHADDTGAGKKSAFVNVVSVNTNWYKDRNNKQGTTRYLSNWARAGKGTGTQSSGEF